MGKLWRINETPNMADAPGQQTVLAVEFESAGQAFNRWSASYINMGFFTFESITYHGNGTTTDVYTNDGWASAEYRDVAIFGGADAATLEAWLENNAELLDDDVEPTITNYRIVTVDELTQTAFAIRQATGTSAPIEWESGYGFRDALENTRPPVERTFTENGTYEYAGGFSPAIVNVKQWADELKGIIDGSATTLNNLPPSVGKIKPYAFYHNARKLPDGYVQLESVYFGGNSVIETDIPYRAEPVVGISAKSDGQKNVSQVLYGYERGGNGGTYFGVMPNASVWSLGSTFNFTNAFQRTDIIISNALLSNGYSISATIGGETKTRTGTAQGNLVNVMIGGCVSSQNVIQFPFYGLVYGDIQARIDGALAYDYVPVKRTSDNKVGYYDVVNNVFKLPFGSDLVGGAEMPAGVIESIQSADLNVTEIGAFAFYNNELADLTLRANQVVTLGENALNGTPIADGNGHIYVPADLVSAYQADANWSAYAGSITAIS